MIPNITRGSNPTGLLRYLFGKGRANEHFDQHMLCASPQISACFDLDGQPLLSYKAIAEKLDRWYRKLANAGEAMPPDMRGKHNPDKEPGKNRIWHCSLAIKAGQGILDDQQWNNIIEDYLRRMGFNADDGPDIPWVAVRHGLSKNGNDHVHIVVSLASEDGWINPYHDRIIAQKTCRAMEDRHPELSRLQDDLSRSMTTWQYGQWRQWAEWKARHDWQGRSFDELDANMRNQLIFRVAADTMPRLHISTVVEACARLSKSEDEFVRRVRREGLMIDPRLRKGTRKGDFQSAKQVVGYTITWRSSDGWKERISSFDLGKDMSLKQLRQRWVDNSTAAAREWRASMENRRPANIKGREKNLEIISAGDVSTILSQAFTAAYEIRRAEGIGGEKYEAALATGLDQLRLLERDYGIDKAVTSFDDVTALPNSSSQLKP